MSLRWNIENVRDYKDLYVEVPATPTDPGGERLGAVTQVLVFATVGVGLGEITPRTAAEFYARVKLLEKLQGPFLTDGDGSDRFLTPGDVFRHVGLHTNVASESRSKWLRTFGYRLDLWVREAQRASEAMAVPASGR